MMLLALAMLACNGGQGVGDADQIRIRLVNPTASDPMDGVDSIRLQVTVDGEVVASEVFDRNKEWTLPNLTDFGRVRFHVSGLASETVISHGRSAEVAVAPGMDRDVAVTFLPVNQVLFLRAELDMEEGRVGHGAASLPDGRVLVYGGESVLPGNPAPTWMELYDPVEGAFVATDLDLGFTAYRPSAAFNGSRGVELVIAGGLLSSGSQTRVSQVRRLEPATDTISLLPPMNLPRGGHCFSFLREDFAVAIGGSALSVGQVETLRPDGLGSGTLAWTLESINSLSTLNVQNCVALESGKVFLQGSDANSTGVFDFTEERESQGRFFSESFLPLGSGQSTNGVADLAEGAILVPRPWNEVIGEETVWVTGGLDLEAGGGQVATTARRFFVRGRNFAEAPGSNLQPRVYGSWGPWIDPDQIVLGCGYTDGTKIAAQSIVELFDVSDGSLYSWSMPQPRAGCEVSVLPDGAILLIGGTGTGTSTAATTILVPYVGD
jgi:hypothetical protein